MIALLALLIGFLMLLVMCAVGVLPSHELRREEGTR
jgi:hypothetical protein